ncbi:aminotransferase class I/II-fold pyridoxal phosphate-dependent enzyme [Metabacillus idriensis]|uniref:Aminotransferase class I/II-fold pyridoxal phosphate-dependent enzyme n=1 Tax=Metabacillus idriensis TaxID=324768 RepID=A0A6I2MCL7_9BACI|nr:aminotransferase class I/II-fold pyridoxal phosphate-dependent enzyme [Metabacillus idriensis]MCM3598331.1 aminotransferase class I/II-fold pyridoxal phosphate-dependent enzyme [Metabacillus idriensis]MRX55047.1 aminotransferase class I/II-fold pyridoxal phosphate-dependent enzyme [Metabacillus idriensis]OHR71605.1 pyridoxal phosphate-dependent aminotransferase [Bacillus sp. HMSC76G11]
MIHNNKRIYLSSPHMSGKENHYIDKAFETNWIAPLGPNVDKFEQDLADYVGVKSAIALTSGTAAIHLALRLLNVEAGDLVFCSTLTFIASANPILYQGATPVFIDSEYETWNMSPLALEKAFLDAKRDGNLPKAVIVVNLYGQSAKMDEITELCNFYHVPIIEDAAESLGSTYKGAMSGTFGRFGIYSFNGNKIITTSGGGMLVSNDEASIQKAKFLSTQARDQAPYYQHSEMGYNYRLSNVLAGIGIAQLEMIEQRVSQKRTIFQKYVSELGKIHGVNFMPELKQCRHNRWLTTAILDFEKISPLEVVKVLEEKNIEARLVWKPLHLQPIFKDCKYYPHSDQVSVADYLFEKGICFPSGTNMNNSEIDYVIKEVTNLLAAQITVKTQLHA